MNSNEAIKKATEIIKGRNVKSAELFTGKDFDAVSKAEKYVEGLGYHYGSMCCNMPIALSKQYDTIAKWRNINPSEYSKIDGLLLSDDFRDGDVVAVIFE